MSIVAFLFKLMALATHARGLSKLGVSDQAHLSLTKVENSSRGAWNLTDAFTDTPPGAYLDLMKPLLYATYVVYRSNLGNRWDPFQLNATIIEAYARGGHWQRLYTVESVREMGAHMRAFVDHGAQRAILAFRGTCFDPQYASCRSDCSKGMDDGHGGRYPTMEEYYEQALSDVENAIHFLPDKYSVLVTGHSLGAALAMEVGSRSALDFQVVVLEGGHLWQYAGTRDREVYALFDPVDIMVPRSVYLAPAFKASMVTLCVYEGLPPPQSCLDCAGQGTPEEQFAAMTGRCQNKSLAKPGAWNSPCHDDTHWIDHYVLDILDKENEDGSTFLPTCV